MEEYLTIPTQRLAALAHRLLEKSTVTKLVKSLCKTCMNQRQTADVLKGIVTMDNKRQERHNMHMEISAMQRNELAHTLTHDLREAEKEVGDTLIKPIFGNRVSQSRNLITPILRPLPVSQHYFAYRSPGSLHSSSNRSRQTSQSNRKSALQSHITRTHMAFPVLQRKQTQQEPTKAEFCIGTKLSEPHL